MLQKMTKRTYELSLKIKDAEQGRLEILKGLLHKQGISENKIVELQKNGYLYLSLYFDSALQARKIKNRLAALNLRRVYIESKSLANERQIQVMRNLSWCKHLVFQNKAKENQLRICKIEPVAVLLTK